MATPRWPGPPAAMRLRRRTSTMETALFDIGPRNSCPFDSRARGETAGRSDIISFLPAVLSLASGGGGRNDATAFIKAHPDCRPEDEKDDKEKEEGQACSKNYCRYSKAGR